MKDSSGVVELIISNPEKILKKQEILKTITITGEYSFQFDITGPSLVSIMVNNARVLIPGTYTVLIEPGDSLNFQLDDIRKLGLMNINITGKGCEKIHLQKSVLTSVLPFYKTDPLYSEQSIQYKFLTVDRKLSAIDSVFNAYRGPVSDHAKEIIKANQYKSVLDMLFISATRSKSDSLSQLFDDFIIKKKRISPLIRENVINYFSDHVVANFILLSEFKKPIEHGGERFKLENPVEFVDLILKYFENNSFAKDYLLANRTASVLKSEMLSERSKKLYDIFTSKVSNTSPFYEEVNQLFTYIRSNLIPGKSFYNFALPDTTGKIHRLTDFRGKVIILDFWFNGCSGCIQMTKVMDSLKNILSEDNVQIISINVDSKKQWLRGIGIYSSTKTLNLYTDEQKTNHKLIKYLNFSTYPKLVVVDRDGNFVGSPPDPRSSKEDFLNYIRYL